jgi:glutathione S-transferase
VCGEQQTLADIVLRYSLGIAKLAAGSVLKWDLLEGNSELKAWDERMAQNPICQQLDADMQAQFDAFLKKVNAK